MSSKLVRKLKREITASPKKAGALGLMVVVAGWFWWPLLMEWFGPAASPAPAAPAAAATNSPAPVSGAAPVQQPEVPKTAKLSWQEVAGRIDADPLMRPSFNPEEVDDPFRAPPPPAPVELATPQLVEKPVVTPQAAGLSLTSTMVGARRSLARVLGKSYGIGDRITAVDKDLGELEFEVVGIEPRKIVLERDHKRFDLEIPVSPSKTGSMTTVRHSATAAGEDDEN